MSWEEAKQTYVDCDFVALVTGSHEQHSTHLPLLTDSLIGEYFAKLLVDEAEGVGIKIILLPTLWLGYSEEHSNFPGTITLTSQTLESVLIDIAKSLHRHRVKRILIINAHGGNVPVLQLAIDRIERDVGLRTYLLDFYSLGDYPMKSETREKPAPLKMNHAGRFETAMLASARPDLLQEDKMKAPKTKPLAITRSWWGARYWEDFTDTGASDDPHGADVERAGKFYKSAVSNCLYALKRDLAQET
jgi:creatinine amidohydrolase